MRAVRAGCSWIADRRIAFHYRIEGDIPRIRFDIGGCGGMRKPGLWQHTCCEAFIEYRAPGYLEFNFAPDGDWAMYCFAGYRRRIESDPMVLPPRIRSARGPDCLTVDVDVAAGLLDVGWSAAPRVALTVVIEECDDTRSYWAPRHPRERPDFHDGEGFVLNLGRDPTSG